MPKLLFLKTRLLFSVAVSTLLLLPFASNSYALAAVVFDPTVCARLAAEAGQLKSQLDVLKQQLNAIKQLDPSQYKWSNVKDLINQLGSTIEQTNGLSYSAHNLDDVFKQSFPGYTSPQNFDQQYQKITTNTLGTLNGVLRALGKSAEEFQNESTRLNFLQNQEKSAVGQTQAIQVAAQIASEQVSQLQLLRQTIMAQTTAHSTYYANQIQQEASSKAELKKVIQAGSVTSPAIGHSGCEIDISKFRIQD